MHRGDGMDPPLGIFQLDLASGIGGRCLHVQQRRHQRERVHDPTVGRARQNGVFPDQRFGRLRAICSATTRRRDSKSFTICSAITRSRFFCLSSRVRVVENAMVASGSPSEAMVFGRHVPIGIFAGIQRSNYLRRATATPSRKAMSRNPAGLPGRCWPECSAHARFARLVIGGPHRFRFTLLTLSDALLADGRLVALIRSHIDGGARVSSFMIVLLPRRVQWSNRSTMEMVPRQAHRGHLSALPDQVRACFARSRWSSKAWQLTAR